jgi:predicted RecA/RadA family phage recombinase
MTPTQSRDLKKGTRVYWQGDATDCGTNSEKSWDSVTIAWNNGQAAIVHHGDMREIQPVLAKLATV